MFDKRSIKWWTYRLVSKSSLLYNSINTKSINPVSPGIKIQRRRQRFKPAYFPIVLGFGLTSSDRGLGNSLCRSVIVLFPRLLFSDVFPQPPPRSHMNMQIRLSKSDDIRSIFGPSAFSRPFRFVIFLFFFFTHQRPVSCDSHI